MTMFLPITTCICLSVRIWRCIPRWGAVSVGGPSVHVTWASSVTICNSRTGSGGMGDDPRDTLGETFLEGQGLKVHRDEAGQEGHRSARRRAREKTGVIVG